MTATKTDTARERALRRAEEAAAGATPRVEPSRVRALARRYNPARIPNLYASRGDVIKLDSSGRRWVVTKVTALEAGWGYDLIRINSPKSSATHLSEPSYTTSRAPLESLGRWTGDLIEDAPGKINLPQDPNPTTTTNKKGAEMATKVKSKTAAKKGAKPAGKQATAKAAKSASANGSPARRTREDIDALVPEFVAHLTGGGKMKDLKAEYNFSDDGPIRAALYRNGYDAKGEAHGEEAESIDASKAAGKKTVIKLRGEGSPWYALAFLTGLTESEVKKIVADGGGVATGRVYHATEKPAAKAKPAAKPAAKAKPAARKGKATKADPS